MASRRQNTFRITVIITVVRSRVLEVLDAVRLSTSTQVFGLVHYRVRSKLLQKVAARHFNTAVGGRGRKSTKGGYCSVRSISVCRPQKISKVMISLLTALIVLTVGRSKPSNMSFLTNGAPVALIGRHIRHIINFRRPIGVATGSVSN